eukprot:CAMPEP_0185747026 /NCGR_PEP_ID=MMETSP1174-20130828/5710_1 /TAXON_ID=35687 /ORGANISM="Dictyocha speculum, Strain CCMP1381" /LENGTH=141 /DNA_ID=CAMNT_0028422047 /DNA_START=25 /DNA_END=450 /DNA_ORIENTATION=-
MAAVLNGDCDVVDSEMEDKPRTPSIMHPSNPALQAKLMKLSRLAKQGEIEKFVRAFVPLDIGEADLIAYRDDLLNFPEEWANLSREVCILATGVGVHRIDEGSDGASDTVTFFFSHTMNRTQIVDREVTFTCVDGDWRADG